jgi:hypothetical protein
MPELATVHVNRAVLFDIQIRDRWPVDTGTFLKDIKISAGTYRKIMRGEAITLSLFAKLCQGLTAHCEAHGKRVRHPDELMLTHKLILGMDGQADQAHVLQLRRQGSARETLSLLGKLIELAKELGFELGSSCTAKPGELDSLLIERPSSEGHDAQPSGSASGESVDTDDEGNQDSAETEESDEAAE